MADRQHARIAATLALVAVVTFAVHRLGILFYSPQLGMAAAWPGRVPCVVPPGPRGATVTRAAPGVQCRPFSAAVTVNRCRLRSPLEKGHSRSAWATSPASWSRLSPVEAMEACTSAW